MLKMYKYAKVVLCGNYLNCLHCLHLTHWSSFLSLLLFKGMFFGFFVNLRNVNLIPPPPLYVFVLKFMTIMCAS